MNLSGKRVLVIGLGESGLAMAIWVARQGAIVRVADSRETPPNVNELRALVPNVELFTGPFSQDAFDSIDLVALSPGVPRQTPEINVAQAHGIPVVSEIELFAWGVRQFTPEAKIVAITGSNGKTTTTTLTAHLLNSVGVSAVACGNISPSALNALMDALDRKAIPAAWVLELSSFQLEATYTLNADVATVLNISEDHLDRYEGMADYAQTKARVYQGDGTMLINRDDALCQAQRLQNRQEMIFGLEPSAQDNQFGLAGRTVTYAGAPLFGIDELKLAGLHNVANAMAALALCHAIGVPLEKLMAPLKAFKGLPHRVEHVADIHSVGYFDDSKGTNVGATLSALQGLGRKVAIILGGEGKGQDFSPLLPALQQHGRAVALIGRDALIIQNAIAGCSIPMQVCQDMDEAVHWCASQAVAGDAVLLSPACASFDMYRSYAHRADVFVSVVRAMQKGGC